MNFNKEIQSSMGAYDKGHRDLDGWVHPEEVVFRLLD